MSPTEPTGGPAGVRQLACGALHIRGPSFADARGTSHEAFDRAALRAAGCGFEPVLENIIASPLPGTLRGLHYQAPPAAQAKLVYVLAGRAQIFWLRLGAEAGGRVHSLILAPGEGQIYTPGDCAHGLLSLAPDTVFSLKLGAPIDMAARQAVSFRAPGLDFGFATPPRWDLLSERDRQASGVRADSRSRQI